MKKILVLFYLIGVFSYGCQEEFNTPIQKDGEVNGQVTDVNFTSTPGGAVLTYNIPKDYNLQYVMAEVPTGDSRGTIFFKGSAYNNTIEIEGLSDDSERVVKIYAVSKSEVKSQPVEIKIKPLSPPFQEVFKSLQFRPDFGGVNMKFENPTGADLGFLLEVEEDGEWKLYQGGYYSQMKEGNHTFRGMNAEPMKFALSVRNRWGHTSERTYFTLTPLFEKMLDKSLFKDLTLPGDSPIYTTEWNIAKRFVWDGTWSSDFNNPYGNWLNVSTNAINDGQPTHITIDLGVKAKMSRFRINHYYRFIDRGMRRYEIWGRTETPTDGSWDGWVKMISYEQKKPSGLPGESYTAEDAEVWRAGDNGDFSSDLPPVRYIRVRCLENWSGTANLNFAEITFWGDDKF